MDMRRSAGAPECGSAPSSTLRAHFRSWAEWICRAVGSPGAFMVSVVVVVGWLITGPLFHYSDTWQLVINTATTIVTFLMVFLIQNTQNRDTKAIHLKLDELLRGVRGARNSLVCLESLSDEELQHLEHEFQELRNQSARPQSKAIPK